MSALCSVSRPHPQPAALRQFQHSIVAIDADMDAGGACSLEGFERIHIRRLTGAPETFPSSPTFADPTTSWSATRGMWGVGIVFAGCGDLDVIGVLLVGLGSAQGDDLAIGDQGGSADKALLEQLADFVHRRSVQSAAIQLTQCVGQGFSLRLGGFILRGGSSTAARVRPLDVLRLDDLDHLLGGEASFGQVSCRMVIAADVAEASSSPASPASTRCSSTLMPSRPAAYSMGQPTRSHQPLNRVFASWFCGRFKAPATSST